MTRLLPGCAAPRSPFAPVPSRHPNAVSGRCRDRGRSPFRRDGRPATDRRPGRSGDDSPSCRLGPRNRYAVGGTSLTLRTLFVDYNYLAEKELCNHLHCPATFSTTDVWVWAVMADSGGEELPRLHLGRASYQVGRDETSRFEGVGVHALMQSIAHDLAQPRVGVARAVDAERG